MKIRVADSAGFCFGVSQIDRKAQEAVKEGGKVYSYGPLVHNPQYVERMRKMGISVIEDFGELEEIDPQSTLILRAHGIKKEEKEWMEARGFQLVDGTCPILLSIYKQAQKANEEGRQVVIIGDPDHPEVEAMKSYLDPDTQVIRTEEEGEKFQADRPLFIISQTTNRKDYFEAVGERILNHNAGIMKNTICNASRDRQEAARKLAQESEAMIVIGGRNSSNTEKLYQVCRKYCPNVVKIEKIDELSLQRWAFFNRIGITAGASTPDWIIEEVVKGMDNFTSEDFMEQIEDSMVRISPRDIVKGEVITVKEDEVFVDIQFRADGIIKSEEMTDEEQANPKEAFHEGDEIDVYVIKLDDGDGNVALSTRRVEGLKHWQQLVDKFEAGETVEAYVSGENRGGLVVKVMGINGFIPASQITTYFVKNFKQFVGQTLDCKILSIDERKRRVVLSSRAVREEQLDDVWENIVVGQQIKGKVVRMTDFGAFVDLGGVDGLIHVSDIAWQRIDKPSDVLTVGQELEPVVLKANRERNRISLGLKQLQPKPFDVFAENNKAGDVVTGTVVNMLEFGAFVRLKEGVEGLIHVSQIANHHVEKPSDELNIGDTIEVKILDIDMERQRIALSARALQEPEEKEDAGRTAAQDFSRYERPAKDAGESKPKRATKKDQAPKKQEVAIDFESSSDIGTNLGDLIAAKLGQTEESAPAQDLENEEAEVAESSEEVENTEETSSEE